MRRDAVRTRFNSNPTAHKAFCRKTRRHSSKVADTSACIVQLRRKQAAVTPSFCRQARHTRRRSQPVQFEIRRLLAPRRPAGSHQICRPRSPTQVPDPPNGVSPVPNGHPESPTCHPEPSSCHPERSRGIQTAHPKTTPVRASLGARLISRAAKLLPLLRERIEVRARRRTTEIVVSVEGLTISPYALTLTLSRETGEGTNETGSSWPPAGVDGLRGYHGRAIQLRRASESWYPRWAGGGGRAE